LTGNGASGAAPAQSAAAPGLRGSAGPLSKQYDAALLDLDGVVYLGGVPIPCAADALAAAASAGMRRAFVTNNASRTPNAIAAQLAAMGVPVTATDVVTSAQAAARVLAERLPAGAPVLVVGGMGLRQALRARGLRPVSAVAERPLAVVQGYSADISYGLLAEAALAIRTGALYVASNADATLPTSRGPQPGNGSLVAVLVTATGRHPIIAGKPEPPLHAESVERVGAVHPLVVGDRLDTDIEAAFRVGADSLLVLTGVTRPADLVLAPPEQRPSYVARDLRGLNASQPEVTGQDGLFHCGGWTASLGAAGADGAHGADRAGRRMALQLSGSGDDLDALRALCAAVWAAGGSAAAGQADGQGSDGELGPAVDTVLARLTSLPG
jgi:glycerol-1-phosphatase